MSRAANGRASAMALDDLIALNDEVAALIRAGVPLEQGLMELGRDMPGSVGDLATRLGERLSAGETLPQILASDRDRFPPVWRSVVEAGLRAGRLAAALEGLSTTARRVAELRRVTGVSLIYPLVVLSVAYGLFLFSVVLFIPRIADAMADLAGRSDAVLNVMVSIGKTAAWWAVWPPALVAAVLALWWHRSARRMWAQDAVFRPAKSRRLWPPWPSIRQSLHDGRMATMTELLALLLEQQVPLHEAVVLAADASGDRRLGEAARSVAERLRRGETPVAHDVPREFPRFLAWLLASGAQQPQLHQTLLLAADQYRQRAAQAASWNAVYLPILLTVAIGGTATLIQGLVVVIPVCWLLYRLAA